MPHIYNDVQKLEGKPVVGNGDCVALVQALTDVGWTGSWRPWVRVIDAGYIRVGTVIATFDKNGRYPNKPTGNHAGFFLGMGPFDSRTGCPEYIVVME
ncbi:BPSL0067 family protein [Burkholderia sp. LMU1-1-1.1]|uniref:BPSL0067 family protein n=1 Tax=Burkholderia sp. LMU1-1-1.1 TaxID=3135266 RepID=UPI003437D625